MKPDITYTISRGMPLFNDAYKSGIWTKNSNQQIIFYYEVIFDISYSTNWIILISIVLITWSIEGTTTHYLQYI
jgi:hypothetical protein